MKIPLAVCEDRDPKGLYKAARAGKIKGIYICSDCCSSLSQLTCLQNDGIEATLDFHRLRVAGRRQIYQDLRLLCKCEALSPIGKEGVVPFPCPETNC